MKTITKISLPGALLAVLLYAACGSTKMSTATTGYSTQTQKNIAADAVLLKAFESGDVSHLNEIIAPEFVNHQSIGDLRGIDSLKIMINSFHSRMASVKLELKRQWADDEYVSDWVRFVGPTPGRA